MVDWSHVFNILISGIFTVITAIFLFVMIDSVVHVFLTNTKLERVHPYIGAGVMMLLFVIISALQSEQILNMPSKINGKENFYCDFCDEWHSTEYFDAYTFMVCEDSFKIWLEDDDIKSLNDKLASESDCGICDSCYGLIGKNSNYHVVVVCNDCFDKYKKLESSINSIYN